MAWDSVNASTYETPMQTGSPDRSRHDNIGYNSFHTPYKVEQSLTQFNQSQRQFDNRYLTSQAVEQQLIAILKLPSLTQRCNDISNLIRERFACNMTRSILNQFKPIIENIFGTESDLAFSYASTNESQNGWMLKTITRSFHASDYDSVVSFLHPDGVFFALIRSLMSETSAKFEFPVSQFPPYFRSLIESGTAPPFFANKILNTSYNSTGNLILNPFEYYIFHFALYILNNSGSIYDASSSPAKEPAYFTLLKIYLNNFVPLENAVRVDQAAGFLQPSSNQQSSIWQSLSSTTTSILNLATNSNQSSNNVANHTNNMHSSLFKASVFQPQTPFTKNLTSMYMSNPGSILYGQGEHLGSLEWRCSTFLLMLTELWFGNIPAPKTNYILRSAALDDLSIPSVQPYSANIDQMTSVRIVIKHLHHFSNSFTYNPVGHTACQGLAEIKQAIWTSKYPLQKRLYTFIKVAFNRWPMDYTFRQPLEAWLSYIQPWRYVKMNNEYSNDLDDLDNNRGTLLIDAPSVDNHWRNFISDNLLYYTVIFSLLIRRLLQLNLSSARNALMLFRAIKVYSQPGFLRLLREGEEAAIRNNLEQSMNMTTSKSPYKISPSGRSNETNTSKASLLAPSFLASGRVSTPKTRMGALEHHLMNLESDSDFHYVSVFSPQMKQQLSRLLSEVQNARISIKEYVQTVETRSKLRNRGWLDSIKSLLTLEDTCFESKDEREMYKDKLQAEEYLNFATAKVVQCFEIPIPEVNLHERATANLTESINSKIFFNY